MDKKTPKNITHAFLELVWHTKWRIPFLIMVVLIFGLFTFWDSLPDSKKSDVIDGSLPIIVINDPIEDNSSEYWESLSEDWKDVFRKATDFKGDVTKDNISEIFGVMELDLSNSNITSLEPLSNGEFKDLNHIFGASNLECLSGIEHVPALYYLDIVGSKVTSLKELNGLSNLELLHIDVATLRSDEITELKRTNKNVKISS